MLVPPDLVLQRPKACSFPQGDAAEVVRDMVDYGCRLVVFIAGTADVWIQAVRSGVVASFSAPWGLRMHVRRCHCV